MLDEPFSPLADGVSVTTGLVGDDLVGRVLFCRGEQQNDLSSKDQRQVRRASLTR